MKEGKPKAKDAWKENHHPLYASFFLPPFFCQPYTH
jgi:hypothetical protein